MPVLKPVLAAISEVEEKYRDLYTERGGKWEFTGVEGLKTQADIDRQLAANQKVRGDLAAAEKTKKELQEKLNGWEALGATPEEVETKLNEFETLKTGSAVPELAKNFNETVNARVAQVLDTKVKQATTKLERQNAELTTQLAEAKSLNANYESQNNTRTVHDAVRAAALEAKVLPEAIPDLLLVAGQELKIGSDGKVTTEDGRDPKDVIESYKTKRSYYWPKTVGAGAGGGDGSGASTGADNPFTRKGWNMTKAGQILREDPQRAQQLADAAGVPKNAAGVTQWHKMPPEDQK